MRCIPDLSRRWGIRCLPIAIAVLVASAATAQAQEPQDTTRADPCTIREVGEGKWIDWLQRKTHRTVCASALWFDGLFGSEKLEGERDGTWGRLGARAWWDRRDGVTPRFTTLIQVGFPHLERRAHAFLRTEPSDPVEAVATADQSTTEDNSLNDLGPQQFVAGLGANAVASRHTRLDMDVGVKVTWPPNPYTRLRFRQDLIQSRLFLLRFRQIGFWELERGFGTSSILDTDWALGRSWLLRFSNSGTIAETYEGVVWRSRFQLYQYVGTGALAYQLEARGETGRDVPVRDYGALVIYRRPMFRPWLFLDARAGVSWPRENLEEIREINPGVGLGFEMQFGKAPRGRDPRLP